MNWELLLNANYVVREAQMGDVSTSGKFDFRRTARECVGGSRASPCLFVLGELAFAAAHPILSVLDSPV